MYKVVSFESGELISSQFVERLLPENRVLTKHDVTNFFKEHPRATRIKIPEGVERLGEGAFDSCSQLEHLELPRSLREIGKSAFRLCEALRAIKIPEGVERLGEGAFDSCYQLEHVELPRSLKEIGKSAFRWCEALRAIKIPEEWKDLVRAHF